MVACLLSRRLRHAALSLAVAAAGIGCEIFLVSAQPPRAQNSASSPKKFYLTSRVFRVPLHLDRAVIPNLKEVCVYIKEGTESWQCVNKTEPTAPFITCDLPHDGEFGICIATVDLTGKTSPADLAHAPPAIVVVVDTKQTATNLVKQEAKQEPGPAHPGTPQAAPSKAPAQEALTLPPAAGPTLPSSAAPDSIALPSTSTLPPPPPLPSGVPLTTALPTPDLALPAAVEPASPMAPVSPAAFAGGGMPTRQFMNSRKVGLDFTVNKVGPSGVSKIDVYITSDQSGVWKRLTSIDEPRNHTEIEFPGEGLFGVRLVATNGNGFGAKAPVPGDVPTALFEIDLTNPFVKVDVGAVNRDGTVDIRWQVTDKNLDSEPINIAYATDPNGPWQPVVSKLKNDGSYRWMLPRDIPARFIVRMEVHDLAGNVTRVDSAPVPLDLAEPDVNLIGATPIRGANLR